MTTTGGNNVGPGVILFAVGFIALVGAAFLITNWENNEMKKVGGQVTDLTLRFENVEKSIAGIAFNQDKQCASLAGDIMAVKSQADRLERISNEPAKVSVTFPHIVAVSIVEKKKLPDPPKQTVFGRGAGALLEDKRGPLLKRANIPPKVSQ